MNTQLLDKWLNGTHTAEDLAILETFPEFAAYQKIDAYTKQIEIPPFNTDAGLKDLKEKLSVKTKATPKVRSLPMLLKVAAILAIIAASYVFINSLPTTFNTQLAETKTLTLPDNSEVMLNGITEISYNENSWANSRKINLSGEAYFKVAKGKKFTVSTSQGQITVLGTQFNVLDNGVNFIVSCYEGMVAVTYQGETIQLSSGKSATLNKKSLEISEVYTNKPEWIGDESSYDDVLIYHVINDLESTYNTTITTKNIDVTLRYTGSYTHKDLEAALQTITIPLGLTYTIESETSIIISSENSSE
ncbi:MAG: anti-sigma factor [Flavobacteriaceae bacterium]|nr:anti-sigma factor [Flavobacteriaceae bacterium]